ncbi:hypothetical protein BDV97DRAFT_76917 [Delphinella strobiligena]|nr:hypothetical protein BDV97DRAFT_76917 [Delphinella strobiligena]
MKTHPSGPVIDTLTRIRSYHSITINHRHEINRISLSTSIQLQHTLPKADESAHTKPAIENNPPFSSTSWHYDIDNPHGLRSSPHLLSPQTRFATDLHDTRLVSTATRRKRPKDLYIQSTISAELSPPRDQDERLQKSRIRQNKASHPPNYRFIQNRARNISHPFLQISITNLLATTQTQGYYTKLGKH